MRSFIPGSQLSRDDLVHLGRYFNELVHDHAHAHQHHDDEVAAINRSRHCLDEGQFTDLVTSKG